MRNRILLIIPELGTGGAETVFLNLAVYLKKNFTVTIAVMSKSNPIGTDFQIPIVDLNFFEKKNVFFFRKFIKWLGMIVKLRKLKFDNDFSISFLSGANLLNIVSGGSCKAIVSERGSKFYHVGMSNFQKFIWLRILDPFIYQRAYKIVPASFEYSKEILRIAGRQNEHKIVPIEGALDLKKIADNLNNDIENDIKDFCTFPTAIYIGRLDRGKGIEFLIECFFHVQRQVPNSRLLIVGDGPLLSHYVMLCKKYNLSFSFSGDTNCSVFFAGYRRFAFRYIKLCRLFVFPSLHEGFPNSLIEAVVTGAPILASDCKWGPRSILSKNQGINNIPEALNSGLKLKFGTLMPVPNRRINLNIWVDEMVNFLRMPKRKYFSNLNMIAHYDIEFTGKKWINLIK